MQRHLKLPCFIISLMLFCSACDQGHWYTVFPTGLNGGIYETDIRGRQVMMFNYDDSFNIASQPGISLDDMVAIILEEGDDSPYSMEIQLKPAAESKFLNLCTRNIDKPLVLVFNDIAYMAPVVNQPIPGRRFVLSFGSLRQYELLQGILSGKTPPGLEEKVTKTGIDERARGLIANDSIQTNEP